MRKIKRMVGGLLVFLLLAQATPARGAYKTGFSDHDIQVTSVHTVRLASGEVVNIEGKTRLRQIWIGMRSPGGEVMSFPAEVKSGIFTSRVWLRFGQGIYTFWLGKNPPALMAASAFRSWGEPRMTTATPGPHPM